MLYYMIARGAEYIVKETMDEIQHEPSSILKWFGSVTPLNMPEDFEHLRALFEEAVAGEVMSEFDNDKHEEKQ